MRQAFRCSFVALLGSALFAVTAATAIADTPAPIDTTAAATTATTAVADSPAPDASAAPAESAAPTASPAAGPAASPAATPTPAVTVPQPGTHGLTGTVQTFSFNGGAGVLGPWDVQTLQYQWQQGVNDIPSVTAALRQDKDVLSPTASQAWYVDDYHTFSRNFYAYAQVSYASGHVLPNSLYYGEGDLKFGSLYNYVMGFGFGTMNNPSGAVFPFSGSTTTQYFSLGPSYYTGPFAFTLRFLPSDTNGTRTASTAFTIQYTNVGHDQAIFTVQDGSQPNVFVGTPVFAPVYQYQHFTTYSLTEKHWLTRNFGFVIAGLLAPYNGGLAAANTYNQSAVTYGLFWYPSP